MLSSAISRHLDFQGMCRPLRTGPWDLHIYVVSAQLESPTDRYQATCLARSRTRYRLRLCWERYRNRNFPGCLGYPKHQSRDWRHSIKYFVRNSRKYSEVRVSGNIHREYFRCWVRIWKVDGPPMSVFPEVVSPLDFSAMNLAVLR